VARQWTPQWSADQREDAYRMWRKGVERSLGWIVGPT
jgi:glycerol kinase